MHSHNEKDEEALSRFFTYVGNQKDWESVRL